VKNIKVFVRDKWVSAIINDDGTRTVYCEEHDRWYPGFECPSCRAIRLKTVERLPWFEKEREVNEHG